MFLSLAACLFRLLSALFLLSGFILIVRGSNLGKLMALTSPGGFVTLVAFLQPRSSYFFACFDRIKFSNLVAQEEWNRLAVQ